MAPGVGMERWMRTMYIDELDELEELEEPEVDREPQSPQSVPETHHENS